MMKKGKWVAVVLAVCMLAAGGLTVRVQAAVPQGGEGWRAWYEAVPDAVRLESLVDSLVTSASAIETREDPAGLLKDIPLTRVFPCEALGWKGQTYQYSAERLWYEQGLEVWGDEGLFLSNIWYKQMAGELFGVNDADLKGTSWYEGVEGYYYPAMGGDTHFEMTKCEMIPTGTENLFAVKAEVDRYLSPYGETRTFHGTFQYTFAKVQPEGGTSFFRLCRIDRMG